MSRRSFSRFFQHLGCWIFASHAEHVADHHHGPEADEVGRKIRCHLLQLKRSMFLCEWGECACQHFLTLTCRQTHTCDDIILPWVDDPSFLVWVQSTLFILSHVVYSFLNFTIISYHFRKFTLTPNGLSSFSLRKTRWWPWQPLRRSCESEFLGTCAMPHGPQQGLWLSGVGEGTKTGALKK